MKRIIKFWPVLLLVLAALGGYWFYASRTTSASSAASSTTYTQIVQVKQGSLQNGVMVYDVPLSLDGADKLALLVGMTANVKIQVAQAQNALLVPTLALSKSNGLYQVLVPNSSDPKGSPVAVPVEVGLSDGTYTQITKGLNAGDQVVIQIQSASSSSSNSNNGPGGGFMMDGGPGGPPPGK